MKYIEFEELSKLEWYNLGIFVYAKTPKEEHDILVCKVTHGGLFDLSLSCAKEVARMMVKAKKEAGDI